MRNLLLNFTVNYCPLFLLIFLIAKIVGTKHNESLAHLERGSVNLIYITACFLGTIVFVEC